VVTDGIAGGLGHVVHIDFYRIEPARIEPLVLILLVFIAIPVAIPLIVIAGIVIVVAIPVAVAILVAIAQQIRIAVVRHHLAAVVDAHQVAILGLADIPRIMAAGHLPDSLGLLAVRLVDQRRLHVARQIAHIHTLAAFFGG